MNTHDLLQLQPKPSKKVKVAEETEHNSILKSIQLMLETGSKLNMSPDVFRNMRKEVSVQGDAKMRALRTQAFTEHGMLPASMLEQSVVQQLHDGTTTVEKKRDSLYRLSESPTAELDSIKFLADKLGLAIYPFDFLNKKSYAEESRSVRSAISEFSSVATDVGLDLYVAAPINHYRLENHVRSDRPDRAIYAGANQLIFSAVVMNIPMFRTILNELEELRDQLHAIKSNVSAVTKNMELMQQQLEQLQRQVETELRLRAEQELRRREYKTQEAARRQSLLETDFYAYEPMMFAVPKNTNVISDHVRAKVGPAWGPDFDNALAELFGVAIIPGQRKQIETGISTLFSSNCW